MITRSSRTSTQIVPSRTSLRPSKPTVRSCTMPAGSATQLERSPNRSSQDIAAEGREGIEALRPGAGSRTSATPANSAIPCRWTSSTQA